MLSFDMSFFTFCVRLRLYFFFFFFQAEDGIRDRNVTGVQTCALPIYVPAVAPGTLEHWMKNEFYRTDEEYLFAIAEAMHEEYKAIIDADFVLQIDDPDLADAWQMHPEMSLADYHKYQELRIDALNHGLRDLPIDRIRFHMCWGSYHGPHKYDIPLQAII